MKRELKYVFIRILAILLVVLTHVVESVYNIYSINDFNNLDIFNKILSFSLFILSRFGVPLFLFLTGALLLRKKFNNGKDIIIFYKHNFLTILIISEVWIIIFNIFNGDLNHHFSFINMIKEMLFIKVNNMNIMWYIPMILGIYLVIPFLSIIINKTSPKIITIILLINLVSYYFNLTFNTSFLGNIYGCYVIIGYYISNKNIFNKINFLSLFIITFCLFIATVLSQLIMYKYNYESVIWYDNILLLLTSVSLFSLLCRLNIKSNIYQNLSKYAFGIFLIHMIYINLLKNIMAILEISTYMKIIILYFLIISLSLLTCIILDNKYTKKLIRC